MEMKAQKSFMNLNFGKALSILLVIGFLNCENLKMPVYTTLPANIQTELEKVTGSNPIVEVIFDPDGRNIVLNEKYDIISMTDITLEREISLEYSSIPVYNDIRLVFNDPDGYFDSKKTSSPFHSEVGILYQDHNAGATSILIDADNDVEFTSGETLYLEGYNPASTGNRTNSESVTVASFASGSSYHTITLRAGLTYGYKADTFIRTAKLEKTEIEIKLKFTGITPYVRIFKGYLQKAPILKAGTATISIVDKTKLFMDETLISADSSSANKLKCYDSTGTLVDSVNILNGSGTFDRTKVHVFDTCQLGQWAVKFTDANQYQLTSPKGITISRDIRYGRLGYIAADRIYHGWNVHTDGNYSYVVGYSDFTLKIIDVSNKKSPSLTGSIDLTDGINFPTRVVTSGNYAFVNKSWVTANAGNSIISIDISTKASPIVSDEITQSDIGSDFTPLYGAEIKIDGNYLYACTEEGLFIFDITDPTAMSFVGSITGADNYIDDCFNVVISGNYAYATSSGSNCLTVIDITTKSSPSYLAHLTGLTTPTGIDISGNYLFISDVGSSSIYTIDISTPSSPILAGTFTHTKLTLPYSIEVNDSYAYVAISDNAAPGLMIIDITTESSLAFIEYISSFDVPYYLNSVISLYHDGTYLYTSSQAGFVIWRFNPPNIHTNDGIDIEIPGSTWGGTSATDDELNFVTGINIENVNAIQAIRNLLINYCGIEEDEIDSSSYFGDKTIGTLYSAVTAGDTAIDIEITTPQLIKASETLIITEGATTEEVTVTAGNTATTKYPPYISLDVSTLSNSYTVAAIIEWKQRGSLDTDFTFDREYQYCNTNSLNIKLTLDRDMTKNQAIELLSLHAAGSFVFKDNWGTVKVFNPYRVNDLTSAIEITDSTNLKLPEPVESSLTLINEFYIDYAYDSKNQSFVSSKKFPATDSDNQSYLMNGIKKSCTIALPGFWNSDTIDYLALLFYNKFKNGLKTVDFHVTLQGINLTFGDIIHLTCSYPILDNKLIIVGIKGISLIPDLNTELLGLRV